MTAHASCRRALPGEAAYPSGFADLPTPPRQCFWAGTSWPPPGLAVAVVGARGASPYGRERARALGRELSLSGITVVSGLARGIDAAAHEGALEGEAPPVAVVAADPARPPLAETESLHRRLLAQGAVCAEYGPGVVPRRGLFLRRNRLVAALARVVVVVEAAERSGALATAAWGRRLGRVVAAVPGDVTRESARGVLRLLQGGARPVADGADVLALLAGGAGEGPPPAGLEGAILELLRPGAALSLAALAARAGASVAEAATAVLRLEVVGRVRRQAGGRFRIATRDASRIG
jgi:DNA processing protein